jgi:hypothetical protein
MNGTVIFAMTFNIWRISYAGSEFEDYDCVGTVGENGKKLIE